MSPVLCIQQFFHHIANDMHIVVFGATSAIAHAFSKLYAIEQSHSFTLIGRNQKRLDSCRDELIALGTSSAEIQIIDFTSVESMKESVETCISSIGTIDIALLAQGSLTDQTKAQLNIDYLVDEFTFNSISHIVISQLLVNHFAKAGKGILIGIGSVAGERGRKGNYVYGAAKSAIATFWSGLRHGLQNDKVRVMTIKPGFVATPMTSHIGKSPLFVHPDFVAKEIRRGIEQGIDTMYVPSYWRFIMFIIKMIPESLFKKLNI